MRMNENGTKYVGTHFCLVEKKAQQITAKTKIYIVQRLVYQQYWKYACVFLFFYQYDFFFATF